MAVMRIATAVALVGLLSHSAFTQSRNKARGKPPIAARSKGTAVVSIKDGIVL